MAEEHVDGEGVKRYTIKEPSAGSLKKFQHKVVESLENLQLKKENTELKLLVKEQYEELHKLQQMDKEEYKEYLLELKKTKDANHIAHLESEIELYKNKWRKSEKEAEKIIAKKLQLERNLNRLEVERLADLCLTFNPSIKDRGYTEVNVEMFEEIVQVMIEEMLGQDPIRAEQQFNKAYRYLVDNCIIVEGGKRDDNRSDITNVV